MTLPDMLLIDGVEYRRADRDAPDAKDPTEGHSPTPWEEFRFGIEDRNESPVSVGHNTALDDANRALILRAVNHHADLVAFVKRVGSIHPSHFNGSERMEFLSEDARKLLAKVKGT